MEITLKMDGNRLTFGDLLALEDAQEGKRPFHSMAQVIAKFVVGPDGEYLPLEQAMKTLNPLSMNQINELVSEFGEAVQESQKSAVPPIKGGS